MPAVTARRFYLPFYICVCLPLSVSMITSKLSNVLIRKYVDLTDITQEQIDSILVKFG
jgi:hypothetical protein